jgi:hypothetical protein
MDLRRFVPRSRRRTPPSGDLGAISAAAARLFMRAALTHADSNELGRSPEKRVATWLFSLGAIRAVAELNELDAATTHTLALRFFREFYRLGRVEAADHLSTLTQLGYQARGYLLLAHGKRAMLDWLDGKNSPRRLREVLLAAPRLETLPCTQ